MDQEKTNQDLGTGIQPGGTTPDWKPNFGSIAKSPDHPIANVAIPWPNEDRPSQIAHENASPDPPGETSVGARRAMPLLDLDSPECFVELKVGQRTIRHIFSPPTVKDWIEFERASNPRLVIQGETMETKLSIRRAADALWRARILRVEGYESSGDLAIAGSDDLQTSKSLNHKITQSQMERVPLQHRTEAVLSLGRVQVSADYADGEDSGLDDSETIAVVLEARWNEVYYPRLVHRFKRPRVEHELRFDEATNRWARREEKIGGQKKPTAPVIVSQSLPCLPTLLELYDELIAEVEGYAAGGQKLETGNPVLRDPGVRDWKLDTMPAPHKSAAVRGLFLRELAEASSLRPLNDRENEPSGD